MSYSYADLQKLSDEDLIRDHDNVAKGEQPRVTYYLDELSRRRDVRISERISVLTRSIRTLTWFILALTLVNTVFVALAIFRR